jgi:hypothetical protein
VCLASSSDSSLHNRCVPHLSHHPHVALLIKGNLLCPCLHLLRQSRTPAVHNPKRQLDNAHAWYHGNAHAHACTSSDSAARLHCKAHNSKDDTMHMPGIAHCADSVWSWSKCTRRCLVLHRQRSKPAWQQRHLEAADGSWSLLVIMLVHSTPSSSSTHLPPITSPGLRLAGMPSPKAA